MAAHNTDTLRILIASDNHLGYLERDPVRGNDSFETFEPAANSAEHSGAFFQ